MTTTSTRTPLQDLPFARSEDCPWERRTTRELIPALVLAGKDHVTQTGGHRVFYIDPSDPRTARPE